MKNKVFEALSDWWKYEADWLREFGKGLMFVILALALVVGILAGSASWASHSQCNAFADFNPSLEIRWNFFTGCLVKTPSGIYVSTDYVDQYLPGYIDATVH